MTQKNRSRPPKLMRPDQRKPAARLGSAAEKSGSEYQPTATRTAQKLTKREKASAAPLSEKPIQSQEPRALTAKATLLSQSQAELERNLAAIKQRTTGIPSPQETDPTLNPFAPLGQLEELGSRLSQLGLKQDETESLQDLLGKWSVDEIVAIRQLPYVQSPDHVVQLFRLSRPVDEILSLANLKAPGFTGPRTVDELVRLSASPRSTDELTQIANLSQIHGVGDLLSLAASARPVADLIALAELNKVGLAHPPSLNDILDLARLNNTTDEIKQLAGLAQVQASADILKLANLSRPVAEIVSLANLRIGGSLNPPSLDEIAQLNGLPKRTTDILQLASLPEIRDVPRLINEATAVTEAKSMGEEWDTLDKRWYSLQGTWNKDWPIDGLISATETMWRTASLGVHNSTYDSEHRPQEPGPDDILAFTLVKVRVQSAIEAIAAFSDVVRAGQDAWTLCEQQRRDAEQLVADIDQLLIYYNVASGERTSALNAKLAADAASLSIQQIQVNLNGRKGSYRLLTTLDSATTNGEKAALVAHQSTLNSVIAPSIQNTRAGVATLLADPGFQESSQYRNLRLPKSIVTGADWTSLQPVQKDRLNTALQGFPPTRWGFEGHPPENAATPRPKPPTYTGTTIPVPELSNGFPKVSGEIVYDWIFGTKNHGIPARQMKARIDMAHAGQPIVIHGRISLNCPAIKEVQGNRIRYTWENVTDEFIENSLTGTLITYFQVSS
jgi:hypothetical protein